MSFPFSNSYQEALSRTHPYLISWGVDWFVQDNWRVTKRLTLDYGIRFSWFQPYTQPDNRFAGFVPSLFDRSKQVRLVAPALDNGQKVGKDLATGQTYPSSLIGFIVPGSGNLSNGMVIAAADPGYPRGLMENPGLLAAPRFGFAYDPFGDGKTAIRGGFGMFIDRFLGQIGGSPGAATSYPIVQTPLVQFGTIKTFRTAQGLVSPASVIAWERNTKAPSTMNLSLSVQRNIGFGTVVDVGYVGSLGRHLSWQRDLQIIPLGARFDPKNADPTNTRLPLPDVFLRPVQGYSGIGYNEDAGTSNYHSLQVAGNRRFARNVEFGASWTWSKAMDFTDGAYGSVNTLAPLRSWNYGLAGFDRTHALKVNGLWDLPKRKWSFAPVRTVLNDWQFSAITTFQSGAPLSVGFSQVTATDLTGTPSISARIIVTGNPVLPKSERTFEHNFNTSVFRLPAAGTLGNAAKTLLRGPGINNWDIAMVKNFPIWERVRVQFRSEFYNAFNHTQFSNFNTTARFDVSGNQVNGQFGQYTAARNPRLIQLALKVRF